jgi:DNA-binding MarR family transcriptional regulator
LSLTKSDVRRFRAAMRQFERSTVKQNTVCCSQVSLAQCHAILEIGATKHTTTRDISKTLGLDGSTVSRTIDSLVRKGLVRRAGSTNDRRIILLSLSKEGEAVFDSINSESDRYIEQALERIPQGHRKSVLKNFDLLVKVLAGVEPDETGTSECCSCTQ